MRKPLNNKENGEGSMARLRSHQGNKLLVYILQNILFSIFFFFYKEQRATEIGSKGKKSPETKPGFAATETISIPPFSQGQ
jgi:hypothetical protein